MFCTKCGVELRDQDKFCCECGFSTGKAAPRVAQKSDRLSRPMHEAKIAGVCAGFARALGMDVTLVRILWLLLTIFPLPCFGVIAYIVCWIVMPKDESETPAAKMHPASGPAS
jgi:phage shock protein C